MPNKHHFFNKNNNDLYMQLVQMSNDIRSEYTSSNYDADIEVIEQSPKLYSADLYQKYIEAHKLYNEKIALHLIAEETNKLLKPINEKRIQPWTLEEWKAIGIELAKKLVSMMIAIMAEMNSISKTGDLLCPIRIALGYGVQFSELSVDGFVQIDGFLKERYERAVKLMSHRKLVLNLIEDFAASREHLVQQESDDLHKVSVIMRGLMLDATDETEAWCDELVASVLIRLFTNDLILKLIKLEKVAIEVKNADDVNHTFFAINREAGVLNDFSTWNDEAIIFDPWHNLVCFAKHYSNLNKTYINLHANGDWTSITFNKNDIVLYKKVYDYLVSHNYQLNFECHLSHV